ncbi:MAG: MHS family MFS transporter [Chloroflexi bacterium]|nr:MAG: MHS family MFS transporter [Chloroflexota bacterium]TMF21608.1 MAG: MHS family MFS transporter [Chloroflexota bacterium]TMF48841.1 MAG: MHS family MFS transporter [Chloroflexota bacterium]
MANTVGSAALSLSPEERRKQMMRAVVASTVGTSIEWYDYFLYGTMTALVFAKLFFPKADPITGVTDAFAIYFIGFAARPVGAWLFGTYGDRIGRKATLIATLLLMGIATFLIGVLPTHAQIGVWAAVLLTALRLCQGLGVGGEWGGSVLMSMEWGSQKRKGFLGSWPQFGVPVGLFLATVVTLITQNLTGASFLTWGWRIPFLLSIILVGVGLYIRLGILETPVFQALMAERRVESRPVREVVRRNWREIILSALLRLPEQAPFYLFTTFVYTFGTVLKFQRSFLLTAVVVASLVSFVTIPLFGHLSDVIGRKRMYMIGIATMAVWGFVYFGLYATAIAGVVFVVIALSLIPHDMQYGPQASLIAESFTGRLRYSGASLGYQLASVIAGGPAPLIATQIWARTHNAYWISAYVLGCCVVGFAAVAALRDRSALDHTREYEEQETAQPEGFRRPAMG